MKKLQLLLLPFIVILTSCVNDSYEQPINTAGIASIHGTSSGKMLGANKIARVNAIDGKNLGASWYSTKQKITPGSHHITVHAYFSRSYGNAYETDVTIPVKIEANKNYLVDFDIVGANVQAWVATENGRIVSSKMSVPFKQIWIG